MKKSVRYFFLLPVVVLTFFSSCKKDKDEQADLLGRSLVNYEIEYSFVGNAAVAHFFDGVATYSDSNRVIATESFSTLPWTKSFMSDVCEGKLFVQLRYKQNVDTLHYENWVENDTASDGQISQYLPLNPSFHIICYSVYSDGSRVMSKRVDTHPATQRWQISGPGVNVSFADLLAYLNRQDTLSL